MAEEKQYQMRKEDRGKGIHTSKKDIRLRFDVQFFLIKTMVQSG